MGIFDKCLLVSDVDGTLHFEGKLVKSNLPAIEYFIKNGGTFTLATGRAPQATKEMYTEAKCNAPAVVFNGRAVYDFQNGKVFDQYEISYSDKLAFVDFAKQFKHIGLMVQSSNEIYTIFESPLQKWYVEYEALDDTVTDFGSIMDKTWVKIIFMTTDKQELEDLMKKGEKFKTQGCQFIQTGVQYYECLRSDADKWTGITNLKKLLGNDYKVFVIGDFYNDAEMIKGADVGAATGNAPNDLKAMADLVTCHCKDGAVADFIKQIEIKIKKEELEK